jgi:hypothetical protein
LETILGIVGVSQKKGYRIAKWVCLGFGCLFFVLGGIFLLAGLGNVNVRPSRIHFAAAGLSEPSDDETFYSLDVFKPTTALHVNTGPFGSARRITFTIIEGEDCLTITPRIWPGETAEITLKGDTHTAFQFGRTAIISVRSGQAQEFLHINIVLPPDQVSFGFNIHDLRNDVNLEGNAISARAYRDEVYRGYPGSVSPTPPFSSSFVLNTAFRVWGAAISQASPADVSSGNTAGRVVISALPNGMDTGVRLFGVNSGDIAFPDLPSGFTNIYIPFEILRSVIADPSENASATIRFLIIGDYYMLSKDHPVRSISFFELRIVK